MSTRRESDMMGNYLIKGNCNFLNFPGPIRFFLDFFFPFNHFLILSFLSFFFYLFLFSLLFRMVLIHTFRACLVSNFKLTFLQFKQHYTHFHTLFHQYIFQKTIKIPSQTTLPNTPLNFSYFPNALTYTFLVPN